MSKGNLYIIGAGGLGREVLATALILDRWKDIYFIDDNVVAGTTVNGIEVKGGVSVLSGLKAKADVYIAVGIPAVKKNILDKIRLNPHLNYPNIIHPNVRIHATEYVNLGKGNYLGDGTILTTNIEVGNFNLINLNCTIGHDSRIANFCSIMPGVNISGGAKLADGVYVGTGAKLIKATSLHAHSTIGAGAVVNTDIPEGETWGGVPAKPLNQ